MGASLSVVFAQGLLNCTAQAVGTPAIRAEGIAELVREVILNCQGPMIPNLPPNVDVNIGVSLNTGITNRVLTPLGNRDAFLELESSSPKLIAAVGATNSAVAMYFRVPNAIASANTPRTFRVRNMRFDAQQLVNSSTDSVNPLSVLATLSILNAETGQGYTLPPLNLGAPVPGTEVSTVPVNIANPQQTTNRTALLRFREGFQTAWKVRITEPLAEGASDQVKEMIRLYDQIQQIGRETELYAGIEGVPDNWQLLVPATVTNGATTLQLFQANGSVRLPPVQNGNIQLPVTERRTNFGYVVTQSNPNAIEQIDVPILINLAPNAVPGTIFTVPDRPVTPPTSKVTDASGNGSFAVNPCLTNLLYPFVTNQVGFDTGLVIANTSCNRWAPSYRPTNAREPLPLATLANPAVPAGTVGVAAPAGTGGLNPFLALLGQPDANDFLNLLLVGANGAVGQVGHTLFASGEKVSQARSNWLNVEQTGTQTPLALRVSVDARTLAPGQYPATITLTRTGAPNFDIPLRLTIPPAGPRFRLYGVTNAASYQPALIAPGEAVVIFGENLGPASLALAGVAANGQRATTAGGTRILFDGVAAPMIYSSAGQVSCFVPYGVVARGESRIEVEYQGVRSPYVRVPVAWAKPALLTANSSGGGLAAALNQDGTFNSVTGALPGEAVVFYGVGGPQTTPASTDGATYTLPLPRFPDAVAVFLDGVEIPAADVLYLGPAPGLTHGVWQLNLRLPATLARNSQPILMVRIGDFWTQPGVRVNVR